MAACERARRQSFAASAYLMAQPRTDSGGIFNSSSSVYPMPKYGQVVANMQQADVQRSLFETQLNCQRSVLLGKDGSDKKKAWICKSGMEYLQSAQNKDRDLAAVVRDAPQSVCFGCFQVQAFGSLAKLCEGNVQHESKLAIALNGGKRKAAALRPGDFAHTREGQSIENPTLVSDTGVVKNTSGMTPEEVLLQPYILAFNVVRPHNHDCSMIDLGRSKGKAPVVSIVHACIDKLHMSVHPPLRELEVTEPESPGSKSSGMYNT